jgi:hypothetical protein
MNCAASSPSRLRLGSDHEPARTTHHRLHHRSPQ